jgi:hypothetical protein
MLRPVVYAQAKAERQKLSSNMRLSTICFVFGNVLKVVVISITAQEIGRLSHLQI